MKRALISVSDKTGLVEFARSLSERGFEIDHSTINRWVVKYSPLLENEFTKRYKSQVGSRWRMDDAYIKVKGVWHYLYRAVDKTGATIDFMLSKKHDKKAQFGKT